MNTRFPMLLGLSLGLFLAPARAADPKTAQPEKPTTVAPSAKTRAAQAGGDARSEVRVNGGERPAPPPPQEIRDVVREFQQARREYLETQQELRREMATATQERRAQIREELARLRQERVQGIRQEQGESMRNAAQQAQEQARRIQEEQDAARRAAQQAAEQARERGRER